MRMYRALGELTSLRQGRNGAPAGGAPVGINRIPQ